MSDDQPLEDALAHLARQIDQLREAGARVVLSPETMAPGVLGTLSQQMPNGPLIVHVDATTSLAHQSSMLDQAFEFLFNEPPLARWVHRSVGIAGGQTLHFRELVIRVDR